MATSTNARRRKTARNASPTPEETPPRRKRKPSKLKRLLRMLLLILIVIAASVGATLYYTWPAGANLLGLNTILNLGSEEETAIGLEAQVAEPSAHPVAKPEPEPSFSERPIFSNLAPFTVTVSEGGARSRILHVAITLQLSDESSVTLLKEYNPVVRDRVLKILSEQHPAHVQTPEGREQLVDSLIHVLSSPYGGPSTRPRIQNVLFTAFVIQ